jgi:hypothetical protein
MHDITQSLQKTRRETGIDISSWLLDDRPRSSRRKVFGISKPLYMASKLAGKFGENYGDNKIKCGFIESSEGYVF